MHRTPSWPALIGALIRGQTLTPDDAAWAMDDNERPLFAAVPGGEDQREMSYRVGINIVMYALTGNYKSDQVHVPAILERLGH